MKLKIYVRDGIINIFKIVVSSKINTNLRQIITHRFFTCGKITGQHSPERIKKNARVVTQGVRVFINDKKQLVIRIERFM
jgi:hypothetical protein